MQPGWITFPAAAVLVLLLAITGGCDGGAEADKPADATADT